jgi:type 1 glutamine amidotransferase
VGAARRRDEAAREDRHRDRDRHREITPAERGSPASGYMGDHPMSWCHRNLGGRAFYTALGHEPYIYGLQWFRRHLLGGILIATEQARGRCRPR